jgi:hypothetical protein
LYELPSVPVTVTEVALVALTDSVEDAPAAIEAGLAKIPTVGAAPTVTIAVAVVLPPEPVAVTVYVVVTFGLTDCDPPVAARLYELPSFPATVTFVALAAVTDKVEDLPVTMAVGLAVMLTVGAGMTVTFEVALVVPPAPSAAAVYTTVAAGLTVTFPPVAPRSYELPSLPLTETSVAFVAVTLRTEVCPASIDVGEAETVIVGFGGAETVKLMVVVDAPPHLSHSSTTVCCDPEPSVSSVFS